MIGCALSGAAEPSTTQHASIAPARRTRPALLAPRGISPTRAREIDRVLPPMDCPPEYRGNLIGERGLDTHVTAVRMSLCYAIRAVVTSTLASAAFPT